MSHEIEKAVFSQAEGAGWTGLGQARCASTRCHALPARRTAGRQQTRIGARVISFACMAAAWAALIVSRDH
jgi:hypothetical protein